MNLREFWKAGHWPTLLCAFLYFEVSLLIWALIGALINSLDADVPMSPFAKGLLLGTPILSGAALRLLLGPLADRLGGRLVALLGMTLTALPLLLGWLWADGYPQLLLVAMLLGVAGASFAVALPLASRWYPPHYQGLALGLAGAGNSGIAVAVFFGPLLAEAAGWRGVFGLALIPLGLVAVLFAGLAKDSPSRPPPKPLADHLALLRLGDTWRLCLLYSVTFGGFIGLSSFLGVLFHTQYGLSRVHAGTMAAVCVLLASVLRPVGGYLADRLGGIHVLTLVYGLLAVLMIDLAALPPAWWGLTVLVAVMALLGLGNGAVFQLVPQRFPGEIGAVTGVVGAAGGVGGFLLPTLLGGVNGLTGTYSLGFLLFALMPLACVAALFEVRRTWEGVFVTGTGLATSAPAPEPTLERDTLVRG